MMRTFCLARRKIPQAGCLGGVGGGQLDAVVRLAGVGFSRLRSIRSTDPLSQKALEDGAMLGGERVWISSKNPLIRGLIVPEDDTVFSYPLLGLAGVCPRRHQAIDVFTGPRIIVQGVSLNHG